MDDVLANLSMPELAGWYNRLADQTAKHKWGGTEHLAWKCLRLWLENRTPYCTITIDAPAALRKSPPVSQALMYHRRVYLTQEKARVGESRQWAGIIPRLQGKQGHAKRTRLSGIHMEYESLVDIPITSKIFGPAEDKDLLYALHGLQLKTEVTLSCSMIANSHLVQVAFVSFQAKMKNRYEWNPDKQITVPNPDFKSRSAGAVSPSSRMVTILNRHAKRLEEAGLAAPFYLESETWYLEPMLCSNAQVDLAKEI
ncbi:MAG: hypothetical protein ABIK28_24380 [Planctomycetota bacterium]